MGIPGRVHDTSSAERLYALGEMRGRMDAPQLVLLVTGALLVGGGTTGLVLYGGEATATLYAVTFLTTTQDLPLEAPDWTGAGGSFAFRVTRSNVTSVDVTTTCTDANPLGGQVPVAVTVTVTGPNGLTGEESGNCGSEISVPVAVATMPASTTSKGTSPDDAVRALPASFASTNATGDWTVEVVAARSGQGGILPGEAGVASGTVSVAVTGYEAVAAPAVVR